MFKTNPPKKPRKDERVCDTSRQRHLEIFFEKVEHFRTLGHAKTMLILSQANQNIEWRPMPSPAVELSTSESLEGRVQEFLCSVFYASDISDCNYHPTKLLTSTLRMPDLSNSGLNLTILNTFLPIQGNDGCLIAEVFQHRSQEQELELMRLIADANCHEKYCELIDLINGQTEAGKYRTKLTFQSMKPEYALSVIQTPDIHCFPH